MNFMEIALAEARKAYGEEAVPIGAVIVKNNQVVCSAKNEEKDPTAHAEILVIQKACEILNTKFLEGCDLYVTLEPCAMCAQAISLARIKTLYFGAYSPKYGAVLHGPRIFNYSLHKPEVIGGLFESDCAELLKKFFKNKRF